MTTPSRPVDAAIPDDVSQPLDQSLDQALEPTPAPAPPPMAPGIRNGGAFAFLSVLRHRNYRLFFAGQLVSLMGTWITNVAQGWLVYQLTSSPLMLGVVTFAGQVPVFFFSLFGGMISDRFERRRLLLITQALAMAQSAALAVLTLTGLIQVWHIVALALFQGLVNAFDVPIRQSMTVEMVGKADLRHAISLNSMMFNLARVTGPAVGGLLIALVGVGWCFSIDALSYAAVLTGLSLMRFPPLPARVHAQALAAIRAGLAYAWGQRPIRASLLLIAACSCFGAAYMSLLPAFARDVLHQGSEGLGFLYSAVGMGALLGAYTLARVPDRHLFVTPVVAAFGFGLMLVLFSWSGIFWLSLGLLFPAAFFLMLLGGSTNSIVQLLSREDMRGRVVALYAMGMMGMMPWGSLMLGGVAEHLGSHWAVSIGGSVCILAALLAWRDRQGGWARG
ncbi:MAG: MFS transporter [Alphaproteobacteria bacterium]|nr:MFS transporter [Alphaproteobacteria bacterium]